MNIKADLHIQIKLSLKLCVDYNCDKVYDQGVVKNSLAPLLTPKTFFFDYVRFLPPV